jgi:hypothetical protein
MKNVRPPQFLDNLYRDMRDRRLLIPAIVLVVALLAVPILLKSHSTASSPAVASVGGAGKSDSEAVPAVVTQQLGVTQYRKRLNKLNSKNPFHQQYTSVPKAAQAHASATATQSSSTASGGTTGISTSTTGTSTITSTTSISPPPSSSGGVTPLPSSTSTQSSTPTPKPPKPTLYAFRVSIAIGEPGSLKRRDNVQLGVVLPSENKPMVSFIGATEDLQTANFVVANTVDSVKGGHCVPSPSSCSLLQLKAGQEAHLNYAPQNKRYNLKLIGVRLVPVHKLSGKTSSTSQKGPQKKSADSGVAGLSSQVAYGRSK